MGGACTVANQCPAKLPVSAVRGNAPDWHSEKQVVRTGKPTLTMAAMAADAELLLSAGKPKKSSQAAR